MPKYTYMCSKCNAVVQVVCQLHDVVLCQSCNLNMTLQMPTISSPDIKETVDKYTGAQWKQDQKELLAERRANYYWEVEVPRFVNSGIYSLETMLENQWVFYDEKGNLQTRTSPPQKQ